MKLVIYAVVVLIAAAWLGSFAQEDPGYVMISYRDWNLETSATLFALALLSSVVVFYFAFRLIMITGFLPRSLRKWRKRKGDQKAEKELTRGLLDLNLGKWGAAEKHLLKTARNPNLATVGYLAAAQAAQGQGQTARRDGYLQMAQDGNKPKDQLAITINKARLLAEAGHADEALANLKKLLPHQNQNPAIVALRAELYIKVKDWPALTKALPDVRRSKTMPMSKYFEIEHTAYSGLLNQVGRKKDVIALNKTWSSMPKRIRSKEDMVADYACSLMNCGHDDQAEEVLYSRISRQWSDDLVYIYGRLDGDAEIHLSRSRNWFKKNNSNPVLLLTLGKLAIRSHQWDTAKEYLQDSLTLTPNAETYQELGNLLVHLKESTQAIACFRQGLAMTAISFGHSKQDSNGIEHAELPRPKQPVILDVSTTPQLVDPPKQPQLA